ncbi:MAG: hypothetical protein M1817_000119 [Caeruleum heppii]|nr:MAG: hypothetical protein M1817_000119 [Caeruleum heppii]
MPSLHCLLASLLTASSLVAALPNPHDPFGSSTTLQVRQVNEDDVVHEFVAFSDVPDIDKMDFTFEHHSEAANPSSSSSSAATSSTPRSSASSSSSSSPPQSPATASPGAPTPTPQPQCNGACTLFHWCPGGWDCRCSVVGKVGAVTKAYTFGCVRIVKRGTPNSGGAAKRQLSQSSGSKGVGIRPITINDVPIGSEGVDTSKAVVLNGTSAMNNTIGTDGSRVSIAKGIQETTPQVVERLGLTNPELALYQDMFGNPVACPCNASYVSYKCCDVQGPQGAAIIYEPAERKLGEAAAVA